VCHVQLQPLPFLLGWAQPLLLLLRFASGLRIE